VAIAIAIRTRRITRRERVVSNPLASLVRGTQFHGEYRSRPNRPHPLYREFIGAALQHARIAIRAREAAEAGS